MDVLLALEKQKEEYSKSYFKAKNEIKGLHKDRKAFERLFRSSSVPEKVFTTFTSLITFSHKPAVMRLCKLTAQSLSLLH